MQSNNAKDKDSDLMGLYQQVILDHVRSPRNTGFVDIYDCRSEGKNPMCGDRVTVTAALDMGIVSDLRFDGKGCAISIASASMMTEAIKGLDRDEISEVFDAVDALCNSDVHPEQLIAQVGKKIGNRIEALIALSGVRQFSVRAKCATLPWHALMACLSGQDTASTENESRNESKD